MLILLMGVTGSGKTTVGKQLASALDWPFFDADDFHSPDNISKMASGIALTDEDRRPWLERLHELIEEHARKQVNIVLACSALKQSYREMLTVDTGQVAIIYLQAQAELIRERMSRREGHFMPTALLDSQFESLEEPTDALTLPAEWSPERIVMVIRASLGI
ncbi:MAG TPA: gluconokinase [Anaerolineales bacterium]|nr:gluconokinase [Anaerolineales bacterium]